MEALLRQVRSKVSRKEDIGSIREETTPVQRTSSFRGEKRPQKWFKRQFSRQMSFDQSSEEAEYAAAVAAAAFAISSLESDVFDKRQPDARRRPSLMENPAEHVQAPKHYAGEYNGEITEMVPEKTIHPVTSIKKTPTMPKKRLTFADELDEPPSKPSIERDPSFSKGLYEGTQQIEPYRSPVSSEKRLDERKRSTSMPSFRRTPSAKRTQSFGEEWSEEGKKGKAPKIAAPQLPQPIPPPPAVPPLSIQLPATPRRGQGHSGQETEADDWEREEMAKIRQRYEKLYKTILDWEEKKKKKVRRKLEKTEDRINSNQESTCDKFQKAILTTICLEEPQNDLEKKRAKAMHNYQIEMERIKEIAEGAMAQAKDKQRNEEMKVKEKASRYRATGEPPLSPACLCS